MMTEGTSKISSRNIPLPIQRAVRQRCGFGCVICGLPLYEYEHMLGWENVHRHVAEEITLLCDRHHREKTAGLLPLEQVREANDAPFNLRTGVSKPYDLHYDGSACEVTIASNTFSMQDQGFNTCLIPISIDNLPLVMFRLGDGHLLLTLRLFDENNVLVAFINDNQLVYSIQSWDIQLTGRNLLIREAASRILIDVSFIVPNRIVINRGRFLRNGVEILLKPDYLAITNNHMFFGSENRSINVPGGIVIGPHMVDYPAMFRIDSVPRYLGDRTEALRWAKEAFDGSCLT